MTKKIFPKYLVLILYSVTNFNLNRLDIMSRKFAIKHEVLTVSPFVFFIFFLFFHVLLFDFLDWFFLSFDNIVHIDTVLYRR